MEPVRVPLAVRGRLGDAGATALEELLEDTGRTWREDVTTMAQERFERRLAEELAKFREDMVNAMTTLKCDLHREIQTTRVELMKWSFLFWIGQVAALSGMMALLLKVVGR